MMSGSPESHPRIFDDGAPLIWTVSAPEESSSKAFVVVARFCDNPDCPCRDMTLAVNRVEPTGDGKGRVIESSQAAVRFDVDTALITPCDSLGNIDRSRELVAELQSVLNDSYIELLRNRWRRVRARTTDEWRQQDWAHIDTESMVPYLQVFPNDWDLGAAHQGEQYWLVDYWCLKPDCPCDALRVDVLRPEGGSLGLLDVTARKWKALRVEGDAGAIDVWNAYLRESHSHETLETRRRAIRKVARELPRLANKEQPPSPAAPTIAAGRNDPCPCGSGKKYKRCCGG